MIQPSLAGLDAFFEDYPALGSAKYSFRRISIIRVPNPVLGYFHASLPGLLATPCILLKM